MKDIPAGASFNGGLKQFELTNRLKVILERYPNNTISGKVIVEHGPSDEAKGEEGTAHFDEHMIIFGGFGQFSPEICERIRQKFGWYIPETQPDRTVFPVGLMPDDVTIFLKYISGALFEPRFDPPQVYEQRRRISREISDFSTSSQKDLQDFHKALFPNHPYSINELGTRTSVGRITPDDLRAFHFKGYIASNMTLILAGPLPEGIEDLIKLHFEDRPTGQSIRGPTLPPSQLERQVKLYRPAPDLLDHENPGDSNAEIYFGVIAVPSSNRERLAITLLSHLLFNYTQSRLFTTMSQRYGLTYDLENLDTDFDIFSMNGSMKIMLPVKSLDQEAAINAMFSEFNRLQEHLPDKKELYILSRNLRYHVADRMQKSKNHVKAIERFLATGTTPADDLVTLSSLTPEEIRDAARKFLPQSRQDGKYVLMLRDPIYPRQRAP